MHRLGPADEMRHVKDAGFWLDVAQGCYGVEIRIKILLHRVITDLHSCGFHRGDLIAVVIIRGQHDFVAIRTKRPHQMIDTVSRYIKVGLRWRLQRKRQSLRRAAGQELSRIQTR